MRHFLSPSRLRRQPPPRGGLAARRCRANGGGAMWASPRCHCEERSAVIARSEATRQSVLPLPPSARKVAARSADGGRDKMRHFLSPSRLRRQPPPRGGLAARRCRANGGGAMWASPRCHCEERSAVIARSEATRQLFSLASSARKVAARSADGGRDKMRHFLSPSRLRRQPPPRGVLQRGGAAPMAAGRCGHRPAVIARSEALSLRGAKRRGNPFSLASLCEEGGCAKR